MDKEQIIKLIDFLPGKKTIAGIIVLIVSIIFGRTINADDVIQTITSIGQAVGAILTVYGLIMKMIRNSKDKKS